LNSVYLVNLTEVIRRARRMAALGARKAGFSKTAWRL